MLPLLPVAVLETPHWRVNFRSETYNPELIPSLEKCFQIIEQTKLSLRGWDYPHLSGRPNERGRGSNWVASWSDFGCRNEYWRLYQSGQFIHLFSIEEATNPDWRKELQAMSKSHLGWGSLKEQDWSAVPGFISIRNFLYTVTEIFEFAARLCEKGIYGETFTISIELRRIKGLVLTAERLRPMHNYYAVTENELLKNWTVKREDLLAESSANSLAAVLWFFERFGWAHPPLQTLRKDQDDFVKGRI
jgi:hypothetical protein